MKLVLIFGDAAVGKMTVGQELEKITELKLFHNHMTIEPVLELFGHFNKEAKLGLRDVIFKEFAKTNNYGLIFTFMWAFDSDEDNRLVKKMIEVFEKENAEIYYVELYAPLEVRLERNKSENRLLHKPSKRDLVASEQRVLNDSKKHRFVSYEGELNFKNYLKFNNTNIEAVDVAKTIKEKFIL